MIRCLLTLALLFLVSCASMEQSVGKAADNASGVMSGFMGSLFTSSNQQGTVNSNNVGQGANQASSAKQSVPIKRKVRSKKVTTRKQTSVKKPVEADIDDDDEDISGAERPGAF